MFAEDFIAILSEFAELSEADQADTISLLIGDLEVCDLPDTSRRAIGDFMVRLSSIEGLDASDTLSIGVLAAQL